jgi:uncharacterized membrane protein YeaQ/YmgE (transglycosylase-associated protein family)
METTAIQAIGALCFGVVVGYIAYRTLARKEEGAAVSDLAAVIAAVGGGVVTNLFDSGTDTFAYYSIGLLAGMILYLLASLAIRGRKATGEVMADPDSALPG